MGLFVLGLVIGAVMGVLVAVLCFAARFADDEMAREARDLTDHERET